MWDLCVKNSNSKYKLEYYKMKIFTRFTQVAFFALVVVMYASCSGGEKKDDKAVASKPKDECQLMIRYIDEDSLMRNYNLAKDVNEAVLRNSGKLDAAQRQKAEEIQKFGSEMQRKYDSNGYLSQASFAADQQKLQKMQADAEAYVVNLQRTMQNELQQSNIQLNDSIENYIKQYIKEKGYDMVLRKAATFYIDSKYDVTEEVIKGLNARYNKVESKK